jgi:hypothetical protein
VARRYDSAALFLKTQRNDLLLAENILRYKTVLNLPLQWHAIGLGRGQCETQFPEDFLLFSPA